MSTVSGPTREDLERSKGPVLLEFGARWCGYCQSLAPSLARWLAAHPDVQHVKVEDGPGQPLGRSFGVKLWPNLVFLRDGKVVRQLARPGSQELKDAFAALLETSPQGD